MDNCKISLTLGISYLIRASINHIAIYTLVKVYINLNLVVYGIHVAITGKDLAIYI